MKVSELKALVRKLEEVSAGEDLEVLLYDIQCDDVYFDVADNVKKLEGCQMLFDKTFLIPVVQ